uniref:MAM domain-containing protein n=1 Tax=Panagrolaimus sp. JU765 TaxID=591449 RepID=A0AC34R838_9BILA
MRAAKCGRADFGIYRASELRNLATIYEVLGEPQVKPVVGGGKLTCGFDKSNDDCAWYSVAFSNSQMFRRARFETTLDLDRFDCTSDRNFPFSDYFLLVGGDGKAVEGSAALEVAIPCQYDKSVLKFNYWSNNETPILKICVIPEDTLEPNCEESKMDLNPLTFEIPQSLKPFRIRVQVDHIGESEIILLDNVIYEGTVCEVVQENADLQKVRAEGTSRFESNSILSPPGLADFGTTTDAPFFEAAESTESHFDLTSPSSEILPNNAADEDQQLFSVRPEFDEETLMDACKALVCSFNYGDACFYRLSGLGGTSAWKLGQGLLGNPHTGVHRFNPFDNKTSGFVYVGLDMNDFSSEVFVLESPKFRLSEPTYLVFDLYQRSMGPQLKVCVNSLQDCPYSNPPLEPTQFWNPNQKVLLNSGSEKVFFIAGNIKQNLYLAVDNIHLQNLAKNDFCPSNNGLPLPRKMFTLYR